MSPTNVPNQASGNCPNDTPKFEESSYSWLVPALFTEMSLTHDCGLARRHHRRARRPSSAPLHRVTTPSPWATTEMPNGPPGKAHLTRTPIVEALFLGSGPASCRTFGPVSHQRTRKCHPTHAQPKPRLAAPTGRERIAAMTSLNRWPLRLVMKAVARTANATTNQITRLTIRIAPTKLPARATPPPAKPARSESRRTAGSSTRRSSETDSAVH